MSTAFVPNCALIPADVESPIDPAACRLLMLDSQTNVGPIYAREEWEQGAGPSYYRHSAREEYTDVHGQKVHIELLPDLYVIKIDERDYWCPVVLDRTSRLYGVYVFDRRKHVHCCSFEATYELHFLGSQYEYSRDLSDDEQEELSDAIREGDIQSESVTYWGVHDIDRMLECPCREGYLPEGMAGGFHLTGIHSVTTDDAIEEAQEGYACAEF
jgi:hypothetical protein